MRTKTEIKKLFKKSTSDSILFCEGIILTDGVLVIRQNSKFINAIDLRVMFPGKKISEVQEATVRACFPVYTDKTVIRTSLIVEAEREARARIYLNTESVASIDDRYTEDLPPFMFFHSHKTVLCSVKAPFETTDFIGIMPIDVLAKRSFINEDICSLLNNPSWSA